jgi:methionyl-tRNA formyltransferase
MKITFFGSSQFGIPFLQRLRQGENELVHIFTQPARAAGRTRKPKPTPVAEWAKANSIPFTETADVNAPQVAEQLANCKSDLLVVIAFGQKISQQVISLYPKGAINAHASLLPKYRGAAPINRAVMDGQKETGITIITLADRMDAGQMLASDSMPIAGDDTAETIGQKLSELAGTLLIDTIAKIEAAAATYTDQDESAVTYAAKLKKSDGFLSWDAPAAVIKNKIHGLWPWPGAQFDYVNKKTGKCCRVTIAKAVASDGGAENIAAGILNDDMEVVCQSGAIKILQIKPAGKSLMDFKSFTNGRKTEPGDVFMPIS